MSAIVVQTVDYGEADRIVHAVTARGRVAWFAHAAKKSRRRFGGALEPFTTIEPELEVKRRQGMAVISAASTVRARLGIRSRLESLALASYAAELTVESPRRSRIRPGCSRSSRRCSTRLISAPARARCGAPSSWPR